MKFNNQLQNTAFITYCFIIFSLWAIVQPYNCCPDENMRYDVIRYVFEHNLLPHGGDPAIRNPMWGFSYAFFPYLSGLVSVLFMKAANLFCSNDSMLIIASRMAVVCFGTINVYYTIKIAHQFFDGYSKWVFVVLTGTLPQFVFLSSYMNNDMLAMLSVTMMIFYCIEGDRTAWNLKAKIGLTIAVSICLLSYYNAYPFILFSIAFFVWSHVKNKLDKNVLIKNVLLISGLVIIFTGWWFIRNAVLYDGDFLGLKTVEHYSNLFAYEHIKPTNRMTPINRGMSVLGMLFGMKWLALTVMSFIGVFGYMNIYANSWIYLFYGAIFGSGLLGVILNWKKTNKLFFFMAIPALITFTLSIYNSYMNGFQPQGRYVMPGLVVILLFVTAGLDYLLKFSEDKWGLKASKSATAICASSTLVSLYCFVGIILPKYGYL